MDKSDILALASLILSVIAIFFTVYRWWVDWQRQKSQQRSEFIHTLNRDISAYNWRYLEYWDFPGFIPLLKELKRTRKKVRDQFKEAFSQRLVALENLNILFRVFIHKDLLGPEYIESFILWSRNWYDYTQEQLRVILMDGGIYPLGFIAWLRDNVFESDDFEKLMGSSLVLRLKKYENRRKWLFWKK